MGLRLRNSSGNYVELNAPSSIATDVNLTLPNTDGDSGQYLQTNGSGALSWATVSAANWTSATAVSPTGTSSVTFSSIPSTAKAVWMTFNGLSWATTGGYLRVRFGTGGSDETTGYICTTSYLAAPSTVSIGYNTDSFGIRIWQDASTAVTGLLNFVNQTGNTWTMNGSVTNNNDDSINNLAGFKTLAGSLSQITVYQSSGNNFDAGTVNVHYLT